MAAQYYTRDRDVRVGSKLGQIGPKWDKFGTFIYQFQYILAHPALHGIPSSCLSTWYRLVLCVLHWYCRVRIPLNYYWHIVHVTSHLPQVTGTERHDVIPRNRSLTITAKRDVCKVLPKFRSMFVCVCIKCKIVYWSHTFRPRTLKLWHIPHAMWVYKQASLLPLLSITAKKKI